MSGGAFDYQQYHIDRIADDIDQLVRKNGRKKNEEEKRDEHWRDADWYKKYPEDEYHYEYAPAVIAELKQAVEILRIAGVYAQRIDWLISGDDGEESFLKRLEEDLQKLNNNK